MEKCKSIDNGESPRPWPGLAADDRRYAYWRQSSLKRSPEARTPGSTSSPHPDLKSFLSRNSSSIDIPPYAKLGDGDVFDEANGLDNQRRKFSLPYVVISAFKVVGSGNRQMKRLFLLITLNVAYSTTELLIGLFTGQVGLVSDAFHLTFGCGLLTFSLFSMAISKRKPDRVYTYGYKRLEILSAFTNALFLMFLSFSLAVEALHAFIQDESEHKHYLIVSAVTNLLVNLVGVWFFRSYARINLVYRNAEDMNYHSVCLHVLSDSIRSAGIIFASWLLSLGVNNAEVLCLSLVSVVIFSLSMPLFKASGGILLQMTPSNVPTSALGKCSRLVAAHEDVEEVSQTRFWELEPAHRVGSLCVKVKEDADDRRLLQYVHDLYDDLGVQDLTVQIDYSR